jgi:hypothetical protein
MAKEVTHYDAVIADLEQKRDQLTVMIETLKNMKLMGGGVPMPPAVRAAAITPLADLPHDAFFGMTIPEAAKKYLTLARGTKPQPELCEALLSGGFTTTASNFPEVVRATLGRHPDFVKIKGQWGLRDWYGNRGTRRPRRLPGNGEQSQPESTGKAKGADE